MIHFYKPNPKNTGTACSFWHNAKEGSFFGSFIKQDSWNAKTRTGSFSKNKGNPKKEVIIKFSPTEIAELIDCIERDSESSGYHESPKQVVRFNFKRYIRNEERVGFSWGANKEAKDDAVNKINFIIGFNFAEGALLKEHLRFMLHDSWQKNAQEYERKQNANNQEADQDIDIKTHNLEDDPDDFDF
jgi:hypothetical protein